MMFDWELSKLIPLDKEHHINFGILNYIPNYNCVSAILRKIEKPKNITLTFNIWNIQFIPNWTKSTKSPKGKVILTNKHVCAWTTTSRGSISFLHINF